MASPGTSDKPIYCQMKDKKTNYDRKSFLLVTLVDCHNRFEDKDQNHHFGIFQAFVLYRC
jgi:hypothetical protein